MPADISQGQFLPWPVYAGLLSPYWSFLSHPSTQEQITVIFECRRQAVCTPWDHLISTTGRMKRKLMDWLKARWRNQRSSAVKGVIKQQWELILVTAKPQVTQGKSLNYSASRFSHLERGSTLFSDHKGGLQGLAWLANETKAEDDAMWVLGCSPSMGKSS